MSSLISDEVEILYDQVHDGAAMAFLDNAIPPPEVEIVYDQVRDGSDVAFPGNEIPQYEAAGEASGVDRHGEQHF